MKKFLMSLSLVVMTGLLSGCGTMFSGYNQRVLIQSYPPGANIKAGDKVVGVTPAAIELSRGEKEHNLVLEANGFEPYKVLTTRSFNSVSTFNLLNDGIGFLIDWGTGSIYKIDPLPMAFLKPSTPAVGPLLSAPNKP